MGMMKQLVSRASSDPGQGHPAPQHNILVIDDNTHLADAIEFMLTKAGHKTRAASSGAGAFDLMWKLKPDLVITDVILPDLDSIDLIEELRRVHQDMKIIAISGNPHLLRLAAKQGADHTLAKPFDLNKLKILIDVALN